MKRTAVTSSNLRSIGYQKGAEILEIEFKDGGVYRYANVPERVYKAMMAAPSKGVFFHASIRGQFPSYKVLPVEEEA